MTGSRRVPIFALTGNTMPADRDSALEGGMDGYMSKPIDTDALHAAMATLAGSASRPEIDDGPVAAAASPTIAQTAPPLQKPAGEVAAPVAASAFDYRQALTESNPQLIGTIAKDALAQYPLDMGAIRDALRAGDGATAARTAHSMNGMLGLFKARPAVASARAIEKLARSGRFAEALAELVRLEPEIAALSQALSAYAK